MSAPEVEVLKLVAGIIRDELSLRENQVMLAYQDFKIPKTQDLFMVLHTVSERVFGNSAKFNAATKTDVQDVNVSALIQVDMMSFDSSARLRKEEVVAALQSTRSQQVQEANFFQIARNVGEILDVTALEETAMLNRYTCDIRLTYARRFERYPNYFDKFPASDRPEPEVKFNV